MLAILGSLLFGSTVLGIYALRYSHQKLETLFEDRVVPLRQFSDIRDCYDAILKAIRNAPGSGADLSAATTVLGRELARSKETWIAYLATYLTPEEKELAAALETQLRSDEAIVSDVVRHLERREPVDLEVVRRDLLHAMEATNTGLAKLTQLQVRVAHEEFAHAVDMAEWLRDLLLGALVLAAGAVAYSLYVVLVRVTRPIDATTTTMTQLASGDLDVPVSGVDRRDEIGAMVRALQVFKDALVAKRAADAAAAVEMEVKVRRAETIDRATQAFRDQIERMMRTLAGAAAEMEQAARSMSRNADETAAQSSTVAAAAEQTSANVQTVAAASEEMATSIDAINVQIARSSDIAESAAESATQTNTVVMGLADGAERIEEVIGLISGIAAQTNLLALNATIEAARAGEAGRGFAVVATEVKALAAQTAKATETIATQISALQGETSRAVDAIQAIAATVHELRTIAVGVAASMEEQGAVTQEIVRNVSQAADGTQAVTVNIAAITQVAGETGNAAALVLQAATALSRQSETLDTAVTTFLETVQAA